MLVRACENAHQLGLTVQGFDAFNDWFYENIVGAHSSWLVQLPPRRLGNAHV
ncbi:hypothetical protein AWB68_06618 [Caballeronia choica]|uniref:Uncharacterized protein n=1 Tax=Caballeronia choica TaxID=326476 RepID=A0A158KQ19_9BURK|nr:hypothetical protein [Caballeronia choica]SAL82690.1 hypothetical protein AWB68_06618 [Caballeronia choica]